MAVKGKTRVCQSNIGDFNVELINGSPFYNRYPEFLRVFRKHLVGVDPESVFAQPQENAPKGMVDWYLPTDAPEAESLDSLRTTDPEEYQRYSLIRNRTLKALRDAMAAISNPQERAYLACAMKYIDSDYAERVTYCHDNQVSFAVWGMAMRRGRTFETVITEDVRDHRFHRVTYQVQGAGELVGEASFGRKHGHVLQGARDIPQVKAADGCSFVRWEPTAPQGKAVTEDLVFTAVCERTSPFVLTFEAMEGGQLDGEPVVDKKPGTVLEPTDFPKVKAKAGYRFNGWEPQPQLGQPITDNIDFHALFAPDGTAVVLPPAEPEEPVVEQPLTDHEVTFLPGEFGQLEGNSYYRVIDGTALLASQVPLVSPYEGYEFKCWDQPVDAPITKDTTFTAVYRKLPVAAPVAAQRSGCLPWLIYSLLALLLLLFAAFLFRGCAHDHVYNAVPWVHHRDHPASVDVPDTLVSVIGRREGHVRYIGGDGRYADGSGSVGNFRDDGYIDDNGYFCPIEGDLPDDCGAVTPPMFDEDGREMPVHQERDQRDVSADRLFLFMYDDNDVDGLRSDFEAAYPGDGFGTIGYDREVPYLVVQVPESQRDQVRQTINQKIPNHKFLCIDEAIYQMCMMGQSSSNARHGWHLDAVNAKQAWNSTRGSGNVTVAVVDDGLDAQHPMFRGRIVNGYNVFRQDNHLSVGQGHGTHVAALAVGSADYLTQGAAGIASGCKLMPVQVFDNGICTLSSLVAGIMYAVNHGADVVNVSVGLSVPGLGSLDERTQQQLANNEFKNEERLWNRICEIAAQKKAVIVFAAGNDNALSRISPTNRSDVSITVTAVDDHQAETDFTNHGAGSDISAPGVGIYSAYPTSSFASFDGTSMAAPIVTGVIALMKSKNKNLNAQQILAILQRTGKSTGGDVPVMVQADKAVAAAGGSQAQPARTQGTNRQQPSRTATGRRS